MDVEALAKVCATAAMWHKGDVDKLIQRLAELMTAEASGEVPIAAAKALLSVASTGHLQNYDAVNTAVAGFLSGNKDSGSPLPTLLSARLLLTLVPSWFPTALQAVMNSPWAAHDDETAEVVTRLAARWYGPEEEEEIEEEVKTWLTACLAPESGTRATVLLALTGQRVSPTSAFSWYISRFSDVVTAEPEVYWPLVKATRALNSPDVARAFLAAGLVAWVVRWLSDVVEEWWRLQAAYNEEADIDPSDLDSLELNVNAAFSSAVAAGLRREQVPETLVPWFDRAGPFLPET